MPRQRNSKRNHHGGAWKVAYADFVTAMMALFMVLWITSQDREVLMATSLYFRQPFTPLVDEQSGVLHGRDNKDIRQDFNRNTPSPANLAFLNALAKELNRLLNITNEINDKLIDIAVTSDGLRITLFDGNQKPLFEKESAKLTEWGQFAMRNLAWIIERNGMHVSIDGHASSGTKVPEESSLWELTAERANEARKSLEFYAVSKDKIDRIAGFADTKPLDGSAPDADVNQRLTISLSIH